MNLVLTGFMGTGKTTVGKRLANRLGWAFMDTDEIIEKQTGHAIADLFARGGEGAFRTLEAKAVELVSMLDKTVIATGGGVPLRTQNIDELERNGKIVLLTASPETVLGRLRGSPESRPLLHGPDPLERIRQLLSDRRDAYARASIVVATDTLSEDAVVEEVLQKAGLS